MMVAILDICYTSLTTYLLFFPYSIHNHERHQYNIAQVKRDVEINILLRLLLKQETHT